MSTFHFPLSPLEKQARDHAILCTIGFLILLPIGVLVPRYARTVTSRWWWAHSIIQLVISGPVIWIGWSKGYKTTTMLQTGHFMDVHQKIGIALLIMYCVQLALGLFIHFVKTTFPSGRRPPQNYFHAIFGLAILALAAYQVHYGIVTEWLLTGNLHSVPQSALHAWMAFIIIFWVLYAAGLALLPRQYKQESAARRTNKEEDVALRDSGSGV